MGHERLGALPKNTKWLPIIQSIVSSIETEDGIESIASETLKNVRSRYRYIHQDEGVIAAYKFLIALASSSSKLIQQGSPPNVQLEDNPSVYSLARSLKEWIYQNQDSVEYGEIARAAAADTIIKWTTEKSKQQTIFHTDQTAKEIWSKASDGSGFCEVSRIFFTKFTERYLKYFLEREASSRFSDLSSREKFNSQLEQHLDKISQHAFETSKITQSFAAGWYNKYIKTQFPTNKQIEGFLKVAFGKLQEEISREEKS